MARNQADDGQLWSGTDATVTRYGRRIDLNRIPCLPEDEWRWWVLDRTCNPAFDPFINWAILNAKEPRYAEGHISPWSEGHAFVTACEIVVADELHPPGTIFQAAETEWR